MWPEPAEPCPPVTDYQILESCQPVTLLQCQDQQRKADSQLANILTGRRRKKFCLAELSLCRDLKILFAFCKIIKMNSTKMTEIPRKLSFMFCFLKLEKFFIPPPCQVVNMTTLTPRRSQSLSRSPQSLQVLNRMTDKTSFFSF